MYTLIKYVVAKRQDQLRVMEEAYQRELAQAYRDRELEVAAYEAACRLNPQLMDM
jgi:hypothetical protein